MDHFEPDLKMSAGARTSHGKAPSSIDGATWIGGPIDPNNKVICVSGLSPIVNSDLLRQVFSQIGNVFHVHIPKGSTCGFVEYSDRSSAERAMSSSLNGSLLGGNKIELGWGRGVYNHIYVGHLNSTVDDSALRLVFGKFGKVVSVHRPPGRYGFVEFVDRSCAERALCELDGLQLGGESVRVNWSYRHGKPQQTRWNDATCSSTRGNLSGADESNKTILMEGLDPTLNDDFYRSVFAQSGEIAHMELYCGSGSVRYAKSKHAKRAVETYNGLKLGQNYIRLSLASRKPQETT